MHNYEKVTEKLELSEVLTSNQNHTQVRGCSVKPSNVYDYFKQLIFGTAKLFFNQQI